MGRVGVGGGWWGYISGWAPGGLWGGRGRLESVVVRPPALVDVVEGVGHPLLLQNTVPLGTEEQRLAPAAGGE